LTKDWFESPRAPQPDVLFARVSRHITDPVLFEHKINKTGTVHPAARGIGRAIFVIEIARGQFERAREKLLHLCRIIFKPFDRVRG
jgi:hypothetical protein